MGGSGAVALGATGSSNAADGSGKTRRQLKSRRVLSWEDASPLGGLVISDLALLTHEQEIELATKVQRMVHLEELANALVNETSCGKAPTQAEWAAAAGLSEKELMAEVRR